MPAVPRLAQDVTDDALRIVHIASGRQWRGGQRQVLLLARGLAGLGVEQLVITSRDSRLARELTGAGVAVRAVGWRSGHSLAALLAAWREGRGPRTVYHAHDGHAVTLAALAARLSGKPWVAHRRTAFRVRRPARWRRATRAIAISAPVAERLREAGVDPARIGLVPSAIDLEQARACPARDPRPELGLPPNAPLAVNVAAFTEEKDHDTLVRAAALAAERRPDLHWAIAGDGPLQPHVARSIRNLGLDSRIHLLGWVDEPMELIKAADLFVLSSRQEAVGTVLLDAMAASVPIVATNVGGIADTVGRGGLLVPPADPAALAEGVLQVLDQDELRERLRNEGGLAVAGRDASGMAEAVRAIYRSVVLKS
ncbi:MAG: glycosyltransferase [Gemmatimonadales bacterium]